jgi:hypothetical protein
LFFFITNESVNFVFFYPFFINLMQRLMMLLQLISASRTAVSPVLMVVAVVFAASVLMVLTGLVLVWA